MTGTEKIKCSADQFLALINLPRCEFEKDREHRLHFWDVSEAQLHLLMDPNLVGDECVDVDPKKLAYDNKVMFYILCNTLTPTNRPNSIKGIVGNALLAISQGIRFNVPDLFIRNLACAADSPQSLKPYTPWIMFAIEQLIDEKFVWAHFPKVFMPPVRDTLRMVKDIGKGKKPVNAPGTASASESAPKVKKA